MEEENEKESVEQEQPELEGESLQIIQLQQEIEAQKNKNLRLLADMENLRKRMQKEKQDLMRYSVENVIAEFLTPLDNFENALGFAQGASEETRNWATGFEMILTQFRDILSQHNISSFSSEGTHFDPHCHEAIEMEESDAHSEGTILQEFVKGYKCGDRVLRPARVKVAKLAKKKEEQEEKNQESEKETTHESKTK